MEAVVKAGFIKQIDWWNLRKFIKKIAGGDRRTLEAYREHLLDFEFLEAHAVSFDSRLRKSSGGGILTFNINLMMLPYAQTRLDEIIQYEQKVIVQAERNHLSVNGEMKAQK